MPELCLPKPKPPEAERTISIYRVARRWRIPAFYARLKLQLHDVSLVSVEQPPVEGVRMTDLLELERRLREGGSDE